MAGRVDDAYRCATGTASGCTRRRHADPAPAGQPAGRGQAPGQGRGGGRATFPAQQRTLADAATIARGKTLYQINCRACHGGDLRGGDIGGPNLLRSQLVLNDQHGELLVPLVKTGRQNPGMPPMPALPLAEEDVKAIAEYIHSVAATMRGQGSPPPGEEVELNIVVGDAVAGESTLPPGVPRVTRPPET